MFILNIRGVFMATIKRKKVNTKATKGVSTDSVFKTKKFWIIFSSIVAGLIVIGVSIWLIVYFVTKTNENKIQDYFGGESTNLSYKYDDKEVKFNKISYDGVLMHHNVNDGGEGTFVTNIFVFATSLNTFYADKAIDDGKDKDDEDVTFLYDKTANSVFNQLVKLQGEIDAYNKTADDDAKAVLYIVDTSIGDNSSIFADSLFGGTDDSTNTLFFGLINEDGLVKDFVNSEKKTLSLTTNTLADVSNTMVNNAVVFMKNQKFVSNDEN